jgi:regulatory protein
VRKKPKLSLRARALQYLARREYSRVELRGKLLKYVQADADAEFDSGQSQPVELDTLLDDLTARGWLSDERAVTQLVHTKRQKGIAEELIDAALPALKESELEAAREVWKKKFGVPPQDQKEKAKQMRFLQSRGFSMAAIFKVLKLAEACE